MPRHLISEAHEWINEIRGSSQALFLKTWTHVSIIKANYKHLVFSSGYVLWTNYWINMRGIYLNLTIKRGCFNPPYMHRWFYKLPETFWFDVTDGHLSDRMELSGRPDLGSVRESTHCPAATGHFTLGKPTSSSGTDQCSSQTAWASNRSEAGLIGVKILILV